MDFRVLGSLTIVDGDREVALGATREGVLLAILLVHADSTVSAGRLVEELWTGSPPAGAATTLQGYVHNLRRVLEPGRPPGEASEVLVTRRPGYALLVGPDGTDAGRFERLAKEGRGALVRGDPVAAGASLRQALALWRGAPFGDLGAEPFARVEAARLEELRMLAIEDRVESDLRLGHHDEVVAEVEALLNDHPFREPLWGQLMLALYRAGRQADALRAYSRLRAILAEELGIEPGATLRDLEEAVLLQKPQLDWDPEPSRSRVDPHQAARRRRQPPHEAAGVEPRSARLPPALSADTRLLVGRELELDWLEVLWSRACAGEPQLAVLVGPEGIGKTRLAAEFARRAHGRGARVLYAPGDDLPPGWPSLAAPRGAPVLIVVDDVAVENMPAVLQALDGAELAMGIVTSTGVADGWRPIPHDAARAISVRPLSGLSVDEVASVLAATAGTQPEAVATAIHGETGGVPGQVHDMAAALRERDTMQRLERALRLSELADDERRSGEDVLVSGVLDRVWPDSVGSAGTGARRGLCPYKGLATFDAADAALFFGRERLVATVVARLAVSRFVGVIGASGSGKSSVVRAGLIPALAGGALPRSEQWPTVVCTPGADPFGRLADALAPLVDVPSGELRDRLVRDPAALIAGARRAVRGRDQARIVVVVDQFEELVTLCRDAVARSAFAEALLGVVAQPDSPMALVAIVRSDYYGAFADFRGLARAFESSQVMVGAMSEADLFRAIALPARAAGLALEDGLADVVCADAVGEPGALPLVSTAMLETWARRDGDTLTLAGYQDAGGVRGALARSAEDVYAGLDDTERAIARRLLLRLAEPAEGTDDVRRRATRTELEPSDAAARVLDRLVQRRLVVATDAFVEIAHEALLREWPRLRAWLVEDHEGRRLDLQLAEAAAAWEADGRDPAGLYRGTRLDAALERSAAHTDDLNPVERDFLAASSAAQDAQLRAMRRTARRFRSLAGALAVVLALALVAGGLALVQRGHANHQAATARRAAAAAIAARQASDAARRASDAARLGAQARAQPTSQRDLALLLAVEGRHLQESSVTDGALETVLVHTPPGLDRVVSVGETGECIFNSNDARYYMAGSHDGNVHVIDATTGRIVRKIPNTIGWTRCPILYFSPDDSRLVVAAANGKVAVFDVSTGRQVGATIQLNPGLNAGYAPRPRRLVTATPRGAVVVWDTTDPSHPAQVATFAVPPGVGWPSVALGDDAHPDLLAISPSPINTPTETQVWRISSHSLAYPPLPGLINTLNGYPVSPDGSTLVTQTTQYNFFDVATGKPRGAPLGGIQPLFGPWFSPDGRRVAVADATMHSALVFDLASRSQLASIPFGHGGVGPFLPDGRLTVFDGETLSLFRIGVPSPAPFAVPLAEPGPGATSVVASDGATVITSGMNGVHAWDAATGAALPTPLRSAAGLPTFSTDGQLVALPGAGATFAIAKAVTGRPVGAVAAAAGATATWAPRGHVLAVGEPGGRVTLWDLKDPAHLTALARMAAPGFPPSGAPLPVFSPDGRLVATGPSTDLAMREVLTSGGAAPVSVFDTATGTLLRTLRPDRGIVVVATFSPDSRTMATSVVDFATVSGGVALWDVATGAARATLPLPYAPFGVQFAAGGRWLVTSQISLSGDEPALVEVWDTATLVRVGEQLSITGDAAFLAVDRPGGYRVVTGTSKPTGAPIIIDLDPAHWEATACHIAGRNLTRAEWAQYLPGHPYQLTCPQWPAGLPQ